MFTCQFTENKAYLDKYDELLTKCYKQTFDYDLSESSLLQNNCLCETLLAITEAQEVIGGVRLYISYANQILPMEQSFGVLLKNEVNGIQLNGHAYCELSRLVVAPHMRKNPSILKKMGEQVIYKAREIYQCRNLFAATSSSHIRVYKKIAKSFDLEVAYDKKTYLIVRQYNYKGDFYFIHLRLS